MVARPVGVGEQTVSLRSALDAEHTSVAKSPEPLLDALALVPKVIQRVWLDQIDAQHRQLGRTADVIPANAKEASSAKP